MAIAPLSEESFCPNCGEWTETFDIEVGWCSECVSTIRLLSPLDDPFLIRHADEIEEQLGKGMSLRQAIKVVREQIAPYCQRCGKRIVGGNPDKALFCGDHAKYAKRYNVLKNKGVEHEEALRKALIE